MSSEPEDPQMVPIELGRLVLRDHSVSAPQYIYLREVDGDRSFPIIIGYSEAVEIQRVVTGVETERPMTHALMHDALTKVGTSIAYVDIIDVRKNTFYAQLILHDEAGEEVAVIDARPSDSIALALRAKCPLRVAQSVLDLVRTDEAKDALPGDDEEQPPEPEIKPEAPDF
jgi:uncharacterized protein